MKFSNKFFYGERALGLPATAATETTDHVILPRVFRTATDKADIYGDMSDCLL